MGGSVNQYGIQLPASLTQFYVDIDQQDKPWEGPIEVPGYFDIKTPTNTSFKTNTLNQTKVHVFTFIQVDNPTTNYFTWLQYLVTAYAGGLQIKVKSSTSWVIWTNTLTIYQLL